MKKWTKWHLQGKKIAAELMPACALVFGPLNGHFEFQVLDGISLDIKVGSNLRNLPHSGSIASLSISFDSQAGQRVGIVGRTGWDFLCFFWGICFNMFHWSIELIPMGYPWDTHGIPWSFEAAASPPFCLPFCAWWNSRSKTEIGWCYVKSPKWPVNDRNVMNVTLVIVNVTWNAYNILWTSMVTLACDIVDVGYKMVQVHTPVKKKNERRDLKRSLRSTMMCYDTIYCKILQDKKT